MNLFGGTASLFFTAPFRCGAKTGNFGEELPEPLSPGSTALILRRVKRSENKSTSQKCPEMMPF